MYLTIDLLSKDEQYTICNGSKNSCALTPIHSSPSPLFAALETGKNVYKNGSSVTVNIVYSSVRSQRTEVSKTVGKGGRKGKGARR